MRATDAIKLFGMSTQTVESDLKRLEDDLGVDLGRSTDGLPDRDEDYYPQFEDAVRREATSMGQHYEIFYCLERSIRRVIEERLEAKHGASWWGSGSIPQGVLENVKKNMERERDAAVTLRSAKPIDYTTFGELGEVIKFNWNDFSDTFNSAKALEKVLANLNTLRAPIAHCCPLAPDEVLRLQLSIEDWFRLME